MSDEDMLTVTIERQAGKHLGIRLTGNIEQKPGIFIADIQEGSVVALDGRLQKYDRILLINGQDVREVELSQASALIQVQLYYTRWHGYLSSESLLFTTYSNGEVAISTSK